METIESRWIKIAITWVRPSKKTNSFALKMFQYYFAAAKLGRRLS